MRLCSGWPAQAVLLACLAAGCGQQGTTASAPAQQTDTAAAATKPAELAIPAKFDEAGMFSEGLAPVRAGAKFGYSDEKGDTVIAAQFDFAARFANGLAAAGLGGKQGYIGRTGVRRREPQFA